MMKKVNQIGDMVRVFDPFPLKEESVFGEFFVDTYEARGNNAVKRMAYGLRCSMNECMKILFMGHRGSGKSTELYLLEQEIKDEFEVISFKISDETDISTMTYIDFVFAIMSQMVKYVERNEELGFVEADIEELYKYWHEERIIEDVEYDKAEADASFKVKLSFLKQIVLAGGGILKAGSESKVTIRKKIEPKTGYLIQLMNQIIEKINMHLSNKGLVFIIEDLDKISEKSAKELFIEYRKVILSIQTRMILTFPIHMAYDVQYNMIKEDVDMCQMLSIIKVRNQDKKDFGEGIEKLKEIVYKRAEKSLFNEEALVFMIKKSGGAIRDLFQMIRDAAFEALVNEQTQIEMKDALVAYTVLKSEYERLIRDEEDVDKLVLIYQEPRPLTTDNIVMSLLLRGLILEYNGKRWCGVHPTVEDFLYEKKKVE